MHAILLMAVMASTPFPLPIIDGKAPAVTDGQKHFRLPMRFEKLRDFYAQQFAGIDKKDVAITPTQKNGVRELLIVTNRKSDGWKRAVVREGTMETVVDVVPIMVMAADDITGTRAAPLVQFVFSRSPEVDKSLNTIDHMQDLRQP